MLFVFWEIILPLPIRITEKHRPLEVNMIFLGIFLLHDLKTVE